MSGYERVAPTDGCTGSPHPSLSAIKVHTGRCLLIARCCRRRSPTFFGPTWQRRSTTWPTRLAIWWRCEEALTRAQEAVDIGRELAAGQPDAFHPDLARSLSVLADCFESVSMFDDAVRSDEAAVKTLGPMFLSAPAPFAELMAAIVSAYRQRLNTLNREPRPDLVDLLNRTLEALNREIPPEPPEESDSRST
jgi:hypothetical protein